MGKLGNTKRMLEAIEDSLESGSYYFTKATMSAWNSTVEAGLFDNDTFVTSENNYDDTKILFTVRKYDWKNHDVDTVSGFQQFEKLTDAIDYAKEYYEEV